MPVKSKLVCNKTTLKEWQMFEVIKLEMLCKFGCVKSTSTSHNLSFSLSLSLSLSSCIHLHDLLSSSIFSLFSSLLLGPAVRVFANGPGDLGSIPGRVIPKTLKWYLIPPCLTLSIIRYGSRVKWSNPGNGVAPSPTPWCSSYRKGSLRVTLDYGR